MVKYLIKLISKVLFIGIVLMIVFYIAAVKIDVVLNPL